MKIFKVENNENHVQWVMPRGIEEDSTFLDLITFDCFTKKDVFTGIDWYIFNPREKKNNFYTGLNGALIFDKDVFDSELFTLFEIAGEILPINLENGETLYILNVMECVNLLNEKNTVRDIYDDGSKGRILKYAFHANGISESSIFKIPETSKTEILTYSGAKYEDDEFYTLYKKSGFTGLIFEEIYSGMHKIIGGK